MRELQRELRDEEIQIQKNHIQKNRTRVLWQLAGGYLDSAV